MPGGHTREKESDLKMRHKKRGKAGLWVLTALALAAAVFLVMRRSSPAGKPFVLAGNFGNAPQIYVKQCAPCHGEEGFGDGKGAYLLRPRPRDFSYGKFVLVSTDNRIPTDEDLFRTISRGLPGSAMPPWAHLPENDRRSLVRYIRALAHYGKVKRLMGLKGGAEAEKPMTRKAAEELATYQFEVGQPLSVPPEVPVSEAALKRGRQIYVDTCAKCHGQQGKGDGPQAMEDDLGFRAFPRDFTSGIFKGSPEPKELAARFMGGMPGTPMPSTDFRSPDDLWATVHYVLSIVQPGAQERVTQHRQTITAKKTAELPANDPASPAWNQVQPTYLALMPLWWRDERVEGVNVRAVHDGQNLAIELSWKDPTENAEQSHVTTFTDGAAMQFSTASDPPFFGMGDAGDLVNIWMWKAVWQRDLVTGNQALQAYSNAMMTFDMAVKKIGPTAAAQVPSKLDDRDPRFYSGWGAGNLISDPKRPSPVENLNAKGFGTLHSQGMGGQMVRGTGIWKDGEWRVVFVRPLKAQGKGDIEFRPGRSARIGFAIWDGEHRDRDGQKSVTIWHDLALAQ